MVHTCNEKPNAGLKQQEQVESGGVHGIAKYLEVEVIRSRSNGGNQN